MCRWDLSLQAWVVLCLKLDRRRSPPLGCWKLLFLLQGVGIYSRVGGAGLEPVVKMLQEGVDLFDSRKKLCGII